MQRRELPLALLAAGVGVPASGPLRAEPVQSGTRAEQAAKIEPHIHDFNEGDIRRYGADEAAEDNSSPIEAALRVSAMGGPAAFVPAGSWRTRRPVNVPLSASMHGTGQLSVINALDCDGLVFGPQPSYAGARGFRDFALIGSGTAHRGIVADMSAASGQRITGLQFVNLHVQRFGTGIWMRGLWNSAFRDCFLYQNSCGYHFHGQNVLNSIEGGFAQFGLAADEGSVGVLVDTIDGESTQSLHMVRCGIYGFHVNVCLSLALYATLQSCDISACASTGLQIVTVQGGISVRDCWIQTHGSSPTRAIDIAARAVEAPDRILIDGCTLVCDKPGVDSIGISVGANQNGVSATNNTIGTASGRFATGIRNAGARNLVAKFNSIHADVTAVEIGSTAEDCEIGPNKSYSGSLSFPGGRPRGTALCERGTSQLVLQGLEGAPRGEASWAVSGHAVQVIIDGSGITGYGAGGTLTLNGLPDYLLPGREQTVAVSLIIDGAIVPGRAVVGAVRGIVLAPEAGSGGFSRSGQSGLPAGAVISYTLL